MIFFYLCFLRPNNIESTSWARFLLISSDELENQAKDEIYTKNLFVILKYVLINSSEKIYKYIEEISEYESTPINYINEATNTKVRLTVLIDLIKIRFLFEKNDRITHEKFKENLILFYNADNYIFNAYLEGETKCFLEIVLFKRDWMKELIDYCNVMINNNPKLETKEFIRSIKLYNEYL